MLINLIADYGNGDPAFTEVMQRIQLLLPQAQILPLSVPPFSTLATGFWIAQLGLNPPDVVSNPPRLIYHNCAPRQDDPTDRQDNEGEGLTYAVLPNGVKVVGVNAGFTLSFIKNHAKTLRNINVSRAGSQFRSRDVFPPAVAALANNEETLLGQALDPSLLPDMPLSRVVWVDGYGNLKTTIPAQSIAQKPPAKMVIRIGDVASDALFSDGSFRVPEGTLAFAPGSSGWAGIRLMELFLRGGSAWERFGRPRIGQEISWIL